MGWDGVLTNLTVVRYFAIGPFQITLSILNLQNVICQLELNKTERKGKQKKWGKELGFTQ